jgi:hypothetical protein
MLPSTKTAAKSVTDAVVDTETNKHTRNALTSRCEAEESPRETST